jgi:ECF sigma factor
MPPLRDRVPADRSEAFNKRLRSSAFMNDVTRTLSAIEQGDAQAADQLLPLVYDELRKLAA